MGFHPRAPKHRGSLWHQSFADCVIQRAAPGFEAVPELSLSLAPRRVDLLLLRRKVPSNDDSKGRILRGLWPRLARATVLEFKSPTRGFRRADLIRLVSYGFEYHAQHIDELPSVRDLTLVLVTPCPCSALDKELACMNWSLRSLGNGYAEITGACYTTYVAFTDQVADAEQDDFLRIFSHLQVQTREVQDWLEGWFIMKETGNDVKQHPEYDEMLTKLLRSLPPERVLKLYKPEERLAGLPPEQAVLALPDEALRGLSDEYVRSLPRSTQTAIRRRLSRKPRRQR